MKNTPLTGFEEQIALYAKGWYKDKLPRGETPVSAISNLKALLSKWCEIDVDHISDRDIWDFVYRTLVHCTKDHLLIECLMDMSGQKWKAFHNLQRDPIFCALGTISICEGFFVDPKNILTF